VSASKDQRRAEREAQSEKHRDDRRWERLREASNAVRRAIGRKELKP
jgi:hypothetical protein